MPGASNDGREDSPGSVITGKPSLAHTGAIVNDKSGNILVTHLEKVGILFFFNKKGETLSNVDSDLSSASWHRSEESFAAFYQQLRALHCLLRSWKCSGTKYSSIYPTFAQITLHTLVYLFFVSFVGCCCLLQLTLHPFNNITIKCKKNPLFWDAHLLLHGIYYNNKIYA